MHAVFDKVGKQLGIDQADIFEEQLHADVFLFGSLKHKRRCTVDKVLCGELPIRIIAAVAGAQEVPQLDYVLVKVTAVLVFTDIIKRIISNPGLAEVFEVNVKDIVPSGLKHILVLSVQVSLRIGDHDALVISLLYVRADIAFGLAFARPADYKIVVVQPGFPGIIAHRYIVCKYPFVSCYTHCNHILSIMLSANPNLSASLALKYESQHVFASISLIVLPVCFESISLVAFLTSRSFLLSVCT